MKYIDSDLFSNKVFVSPPELLILRAQQSAIRGNKRTELFSSQWPPSSGYIRAPISYPCDSVCFGLVILCINSLSGPSSSKMYSSRFLTHLPIKNHSFYSKRGAHYIVNQHGEKVLTSKRNHIRTEREKWQDVVPMGQEPELKKMAKLARDERLQSDPAVAKKLSDSKMQSLKDKLISSG